jgi:hypothetical protein
MYVFDILDGWERKVLEDYRFGFIRTSFKLLEG